MCVLRGLGVWGAMSEKFVSKAVDNNWGCLECCAGGNWWEGVAQALFLGANPKKFTDL